MGSADDARIAELAARQHGVLTRAQLVDAGLTTGAIQSRLRAGRLIAVHTGVYLPRMLAGPLRPARQAEMAAVLACGRGAAVGHRNALWLLELMPRRPSGAVHILLRSGRCRRRGIVAHRVASLPPSDLCTVRGIPTTRPIRSVLDTAAGARPRELEQVIARAERLGLLDLDALRSRVAREEGRRGIRLLRSILTRSTPAFTRSQAEEGLLHLVRRAGLPEPRCNVRVQGHEVDFFWPDHRVVVEVDGFAYHASRRSFERDRDRDGALAALGIQVQRVTWRQLEDEPFLVVRRLTAVLTRADARRGAGSAVRDSSREVPSPPSRRSGRKDDGS